MIRNFTVLSLILISSAANANVSAIFSADSSVFHLIVQGPAGDKDASTLFDLMVAPAVDQGAVIEKTASYSIPSGQRSFVIGCRMSKNNPDFGSCTITITKDAFTNVEDSDSRKYLAYSVWMADEAHKIAALFKVPSKSAIFFRSGDQKLDLAYGFSPDPTNFALVFVERK